MGAGVLRGAARGAPNAGTAPLAHSAAWSVGRCFADPTMEFGLDLLGRGTAPKVCVRFVPS